MSDVGNVIDNNKIVLEDDSELIIKVNFGTLYYMKKIGILSKDGKKMNISTNDPIELMANLVYVILNSNGRRVTLEEAIELVPLDDEIIQQTFEDFTKNIDKYSKKKGKQKNLEKQVKKVN